jgi:LuxR family transcriptional regulator, maltose regulon positive regulatory protein
MNAPEGSNRLTASARENSRMTDGSRASAAWAAPRSFPRSPRTLNSPVLALVPRAADVDDVGRERDQARGAVVALRTAGHNPPAVAVKPSHALDDFGSATVLRGWLVQSLLLEAIMRDGVGDAAAAEDALERALDTAEHDRVLLPFLVHPVPALLERYAGLRGAHANLIAEVFTLLVGQQTASAHPTSEPLREPLTETEARVLRYLPTNLSKPEIANELYVSVDTIKTHVKHLYAKLDAHSRQEAVRRARELGLLPQWLRNR